MVVIIIIVMTKKVSKKLAAFAKELAKDSTSAERAAIKAGYSAKSASCQAVRLCKHPYVIESLKKATDKAVNKLSITYEKKIKVLWDIATDKESPDKRAAISAIDVINKMDSAYTIKTDITTNGESLNAVVILPHNSRDEKTC